MTHSAPPPLGSSCGRARFVLTSEIQGYRRRSPNLRLARRRMRVEAETALGSIYTSCSCLGVVTGAPMCCGAAPYRGQAFMEPRTARRISRVGARLRRLAASCISQHAPLKSRSGVAFQRCESCRRFRDDVEDCDPPLYDGSSPALLCRPCYHFYERAFQSINAGLSAEPICSRPRTLPD